METFARVPSGSRRNERIIIFCDMIQNEPLKHCFNRAGVMVAQATARLLYACNAADYSFSANTADVLVILGKVRGGFGQYFPVGVEVATIQAAITEAVRALNAYIAAAATASGEPTPGEFPAHVFTTSEPFAAAQVGVINAAIEFVRVSCCGAGWYLNIADGENYRREAARSVELLGEAREIVPLTADDEREAAAALVPIAEHVEAIRAALNIPDFPEMKPNEVNARIVDLYRVLEYLTEPIKTPEQAARMLNRYREFSPLFNQRKGLGFPTANAWDIPDIL